MFTHTDWLVHLERHKDLLREAEKERLATIVLRTLKTGEKAKPKQEAQTQAQGIPCCETATA